MEKSVRVFAETEALRQRSPLDEDAGARRRAGDGAESSRMGEFQAAEGAKETVPARALSTTPGKLGVFSGRQFRAQDEKRQTGEVNIRRGRSGLGRGSDASRG